jgi:hypothetical protein
MHLSIFQRMIYFSMWIYWTIFLNLHTLAYRTSNKNKFTNGELEAYGIKRSVVVYFKVIPQNLTVETKIQLGKCIFHCRSDSEPSQIFYILSVQQGRCRFACFQHRINIEGGGGVTYLRMMKMWKLLWIEVNRQLGRPRRRSGDNNKVDLMETEKENEGLWTGFVWLKIGTSGDLFWPWQWTYEIDKMSRISWLAKQFLDSQWRGCFMMLDRSTLERTVRKRYRILSQVTTSDTVHTRIVQ